MSRFMAAYSISDPFCKKTEIIFIIIALNYFYLCPWHYNRVYNFVTIIIILFLLPVEILFYLFFFISLVCHFNKQRLDDFC